MAGDVRQQLTRALHVLAELTPQSGRRNEPGELSVPTQWFRWLPATAVHPLLGSPMTSGFRLDEPSASGVLLERTYSERLAAIDQLRPAKRSLAVGWLFVAGTVEREDGGARRIFHPLVTRPVRVARRAETMTGRRGLIPTGDAVITPVVGDPRRREQLESSIAIGGGALLEVRDPTIPDALLRRLSELHSFAKAVAAAAGLSASRIVPVTDAPQALVERDGLVVVAGLGVYATHETADTGRAESIREWAERRPKRWTAFHSLYVERPGAERARAPATRENDIHSPFLLTPVQRRAVVSSRSDPVTVVSGAAGTGKSHTVVAIACDALARGQSVLVTAKSDATIDALLDLLERSPGPDPVVFGSNERRDALAARLSAGQLQPQAPSSVAAARAASERARAAELAAVERIVDHLRAEQLLSSPGGDAPARHRSPGLFDRSTDLAEVAALFQDLDRAGSGWKRRRAMKRALRVLHQRARCRTDTSLEELADDIRLARAARIATELDLGEGVELGKAWIELRTLGDAAREQRARSLAAESRSEDRLNRSTLPAIGALATALRSGRAARRSLLERLDDHKLTTALPLWVGSLPDIDDLLPPVAALFDLVILDEASSIDQPLAASALLRGHRAVIVGDPKQLRHVSFLSDQRLAEVLDGVGLAEQPLLASRLDVRRNSLFDVAAAIAPVLTLDEHFRSDPHLFDFVADRLYGGQVKVATRAPSTVSTDCIHEARIAGHRNSKGVVEAEVGWIIDELIRLRRQGVRSVGVISPFRAQADALEAAALERFSLLELEILDLRIGTVHAFQGNERDVVLVSLGVGPDQDGNTWRFVEDPHLLAVMVTRARKEMTIVHSADPPPGGIVADYLALADAPPGRPPAAAPPTAWTGEVAGELRSAGVDLTTSYPTGRHVLDICVERQPDTAIECEVHHAGPEAHIDRHLALLRGGWRVLQALPSQWADRRGELIVELLRRLDTPSRAS